MAMRSEGRLPRRPRVSVLVPLYNHERSVEAALDSILRSRTAHVELIVCDDASSDRSFDLTAAWVRRNGHRFARVELMSNPKNLGITGNLNRLMQSASGDYVTLFASDDELAPEAVERQADCLDSHPEWDFLFANCALIDQDGGVVKTKVVGDRRAVRLRSSRCALVDLVYRWYLPWSRLFARREKFLKLGPYKASHIFEDRWAALKIADTRRFGYLHEVVHHYRLRRGEVDTPGVSRQQMVKDLLEVEHEAISETRGLLRLLVAINSGAYVRTRRWSPWRVACRLMQIGILRFHHELTGGE
jgi:glycosyltransferase involved in cell wall biosynthesis